jgi:hypothetical protein
MSTDTATPPNTWCSPKPCKPQLWLHCAVPVQNPQPQQQPGAEATQHLRHMQPAAWVFALIRAPSP